MHCVYILFSEKLNRFYVGYTSDLDIRLQFHKQKDQSRKFTYNADDWTVFFTLVCRSEPQAIAIEKHIKKMKSATYIRNLAIHPEISQKLLLKYTDC